MSGRHWTPFEIEIILHHYGSEDPFPRASAPLYRSTVKDLVARDVLFEEQVGNGETYFAPTAKGKAFVELLLSTPEPRNVWLDPRNGKEIMEESHQLYAAPGWIKEP